MPQKNIPEELLAYERPIRHSTTILDSLFLLILGGCGLLFLALGLFFTKVTPITADTFRQVKQIATTFIMEQKQAPVQKKPTKPLDLTKNPTLKQNSDSDTPMPEKPAKKAVYGLRKVYAKGIGSESGSLSDAVVGKLGNTLDKEVDTITATLDDLKGEVVPTSTITRAPKYKKVVKPEYCKEMLENNVEGVIRLKVLVDIDGKVKKVQALNDLGFGSVKQAIAACYDIEFDPAMRDNQPVAVWIIIPIRFEKIG